MAAKPVLDVSASEGRFWLTAGRVVAGGQIAVIACILASCVLFGIVYIGGFIDDTGYHIPNAVRIAQHLNPYFVDSPVDSHWFPAGAETAVALLVLLTGSLYVTNLSGAACVVAFVFLMYRFAGLWCADRLGRLTTALCVATIPLMIGQSLAFYIDIHLALIICFCLYLQCASLVRRQAGYAYRALAMALLAPSLKYTGLLLLLFPLLPACAYCIWMAPPPRRPSNRVLAVIACAALFTSGWYVRNWVERGNPVFPFEVSRTFRPILALVHVPFESDPEHTINSPRTSLPYPLLPDAWLQPDFSPHMTADGFGTSGTVAGICVLLSLLWIGNLPPARRRAWLFLWVVVPLMVLVFPMGLQIPRYLLCLPVLAALGPAVLCEMVRGTRARHLVVVSSGAMLVFGVTYAYLNLLAPGVVWNNVRVAAAHLVPYQPAGIRSYSYVQPGHLRIGYTSGFRKYIGTLYDPHLTNTLIPLHYKNYPYNYSHEMASADEFVEYVRSLHLDYIHIFDPEYPGVDLLRKKFRDKIMPEEMRDG